MSSGVRGHLLSPAERGELDRADALLRWESGRIVEGGEGPLERVQDLGGDGLLLVPGLVDIHIHLPQLRVRGCFQDALLPWLREHIWPEEARFSESAYRGEVEAEFREALLRAGTTSAVVFGSPHSASVPSQLRDLAPLTVQGGEALMDRNSPPELTRDTEEILRSCARLAGEFGAAYRLTPRFVPTCSEELLAGLGALAREGVGVQSHVAENLDEVAWVAELHPDARSYLDVYEQAGLLGPRTILAHGIHLDSADRARLAATGTVIAHCPTSNVALGSGRMPFERHAAAGVRMALATDVGAGPEVSMLDVMASFLAVHAGHAEVDPRLALRLATLAGAEAMGEGRNRGALLPGRVADVVGLRVPGGLRRGETGSHALGRVLLEFAGRWEDAVACVWVGGHRVR